MAETQLVEKLARLARLELRASERSRIEREFVRILEFVAVVERIQTGALPPLRTTITGVRHVWREDRIEPSVLAEALLALAPESDRGMVKVPAIL